MLDLGAVHETAEAALNDVPLGAAWKGTRILSTKGVLKNGRNKLRVDVANLWIHKVVHSPPWDRKAVAQTYGARWGEPEVAIPAILPPSGLTGVVRLIPRKQWTLSL